jgi:hypothetical protein
MPPAPSGDLPPTGFLLDERIDAPSRSTGMPK